MADSSSTFWALFLQEAYEQLELIEAMLSSDDVIDIHALFRYFHTLKGGFNAASLSSLSSITHQCEDVLSFYRASEKNLPAEFVHTLFDVLAYLRKGLLFAEENQTSPAVDGQLAAKIKQFIAEQQSSEESPYTQLVIAAKASVPAIALSLQPAANSQRLQASLQPFIQLVQEHKLVNLNKALASLLTHLAEESDQPTIVSAVARCFEQLYLIEDIYQIDLSLSLAAQLSRRQLLSPFNQLLKQTSEQLEQQHDADLLDVQHYLAAMAWFSLLKQWRYLSHLLRKIQHSEQAAHAVALIQKMIALMLAIDAKESIIAETMEQQLEQLRLSLSNTAEQQTTVNSHNDTLLQNLLAKYDKVTEQALQGLSPKQQQTLSQALADNHHVFVLELDFKQQDIAEKVFARLDEQTDIVHSFTIFHNTGAENSHTHFGFLCVSQHSFEEISSLLRELDKNSVVFAPTANQHDQSLPSKKLPDNTIDALDELKGDTARALSNIRVEGRLLDAVIDQVSNIKVQLNQLNQVIENALSEQQVDSGSQQLLKLVYEQQQALLSQVDRAQELNLQLRVVNIDFALRRFHSFVRTTANKLGKQANLLIEGGETKIDKSLVDALAEPIAHLVRNAVDHGIESPEQRLAAGKTAEGHILIKAAEKGGKIFLNIIDDGRGLDQQAVLARAIELGILQQGQEYPQETIFQQIFFPGFSMAKQVSELSGRGVGMDVVKNTIVSAGGTIQVSSTLGQGVDIELVLPVSAQIQKVLLLQQAGQLYALPERWLLEITAYKQVFNPQQQVPYIDYQGQAVPLYFIDQLFCLPQKDKPAYAEVVILQHDVYIIAVAVENVLARTEVFLKQQDDYLKHISGIAAASVLSDGQIALVIDGLGLFSLALGKNIHGLKA